MHLYIAYKNYSSWSLRPWIALKVANIPFEETQLTFFHDERLEELGAQWAIPAQVPILEDQGRVIWDSLAILEYVHERYPDRNLWPADQGLRALARCASAQMHSGFQALRSEHPMNCRRRIQMQPSSAVQADLDRLAQVWSHFDKEENKPAGDFLCGHFSIVDAMYAPVMWRILGYGLQVSPSFDRWAQAMYALPAMQEWLEAAEQEPWEVAKYDQVGA